MRLKIKNQPVESRIKTKKIVYLWLGGRGFHLHSTRKSGHARKQCFDRIADPRLGHKIIVHDLIAVADEGDAAFGETRRKRLLKLHLLIGKYFLQRVVFVARRFRIGADEKRRRPRREPGRDLIALSEQRIEQ